MIFEFRVVKIWQQMDALDKESTRKQCRADWERIELDTTMSTIKFKKITTTNNKRLTYNLNKKDIYIHK